MKRGPLGRTDESRMNLASGGALMKAVVRMSPLILFLVTACISRTGAIDVAQVRKTLDSTLAVHARYFQEGDVPALVEAYTEDAVVRPANMEPVRGREALRAVLPAWISAAPIKALEYTTEDLAVYGDTAFQINSYKATAQPPGSAEVTDHGTCVAFWSRDNRSVWRIYRSVCNSSVPPQQQANRSQTAR